MEPPPVWSRAVIALMEAALDKHAERGWGEQPAMLAMVYLISDPDLEARVLDEVPGGPDEVVLYGIEAFPVQPNYASNKPGQGLLWIGGQMRYENSPPIGLVERPDRFSALLFIGEALAVLDDGREMDTRMAMVLDIEGRYYSMVHFRDGEAQLKVLEPALDHSGNEDAIIGNVAIGLRDMMIGLARELPPGYIAVDHVAALAVEGLEDEHDDRTDA